MKRCSIPSPPGFQHGKAGKITAIVFYPDTTSGAQWVAALRRALWNLCGQDAADPRPWRLDILEWPEMRAQARQDVACSKVVVVPSDDAYAGSAFFRTWAETWPAVPAGQRLLLVPQHGVAGTPSRLQQFARWLQELAARKGMDFVDTDASGLPANKTPFSHLADSADLGKWPGRGIPELNSPLAA